MKWYVCKHCGNIIEYTKSSGVPVMCCGEKMVELVPGTTDAAVEKHVPVVTVVGKKVTVDVGSVTHPMTADHYISLIVVETKKGHIKVNLDYTSEPKAVVTLSDDDEYVTAYAYCNLHGLWKAE